MRPTRRRRRKRPSLGLGLGAAAAPGSPAYLRVAASGGSSGLSSGEEGDDVVVRITLPPGPAGLEFETALPGLQTAVRRKQGWAASTPVRVGDVLAQVGARCVAGCSFDQCMAALRAAERPTRVVFAREAAFAREQRARTARPRPAEFELTAGAGGAALGLELESDFSHRFLQVRSVPLGGEAAFACHQRRAFAVRAAMDDAPDALVEDALCPLKPGDLLLAVAGQRVVGEPFADVMAALRAAPRPLVLRFRTPEAQACVDRDTAAAAGAAVMAPECELVALV